MRCASTAGAALVLCAATAGLLSAQDGPAQPESPRFASWDEMNLLAHGLLQLGHGLREHVERTRGQLGELERRLGACGATCQGSGASTAPPQVSENPVPSDEPATETLRNLQMQIKAQNNKIKQLFQKVAQQQRHLEKQQLKIQNLQNQVGLLAPGHLHKGLAKSARKKRLPKMAQAVAADPAWNASRLHHGGWTMIQRRQDGSVDFNQPWEAYKAGFGDPQGEFWLGLEKVHCILGDRGSHLAVQLQDWEGNSESLEFSIRLGGEDTAYSLRLTAPVAGELGVATAGIPENSSLPFSTWDQDHDLRGDLNCAKTLSGGWWFGTCGHSNLNGQYFHSVPRQRQQRKKGIFWKTWRGRYYPLKATIMLIRPMGAAAAS
ncbi:angiopoietin-related protein 4 isoform X3 [Ochotona curzoniae]|uniref:angiopoietin-related protein 4 isoform X3 n=1 Tax=Ochotona curzoniae TaxID=130825 RepID=UPI001B350839|nr:angiopoietin-related protein 4 isoform X3 [Ochotona curzoniae]